ncbi:hypothetical protein AGABI2DRAFT_194632 [Agaricus bisporus var. bisporus H97]|uniref:hypothetical protein n=1 Tax=Agaricus bisporus var. bisporus (strain H97 / ATCC MYA-4626 / FGSC 10389) TaxID=936046 RepID=UPI00029F7DFF|nr:hypothetical protein AGABI2DRAFT_194632 [Agaricus bisporus var. bisporus H97]EKV44706.1 hypothetical protein AGABI2DRAFT_194632 [Agaricus bisporus var. bisporus H97]
MKKTQLSGTDLIHGDHTFSYYKGAGGPVAPPISVSATFRSPHPDENATHYTKMNNRNPERHLYSRYTQDVSTRAEHILSKILNGYAITYTSGVNAAFAALMQYHPKRIAFREIYLGCLVGIEIYRKSRPEVELVDLDADFKPGDLCWVETPSNPEGESKDIQYYADKVHKAGGKLIVDSTFGPPPLQDPFQFGADCVMHSGTKYLGGHSDLLCGVLVVKTAEEWNELHHTRTYTGNVMGSLESWLLLRSLKTLHLRVARQSESATALAQWLRNLSKTPKDQVFDGVPGGVVTKVWHSSLQEADARGFHPKNQMTGGFNATFSIEVANTKIASKLPHELKYFVPATSLGAVESLVEYRADTDSRVNPKLVRFSIGVEELEDLKADLRQAFQKLGSAQAKL